MTPSREHNDATAFLRRMLPEDALEFTTCRSGGPGGQNVNKVSTRVTLWFDLNGCEALTPAQKRRIHTKLAGRVNKNGSLRVVSSRHRTQLANRRAATERFYLLLADALTPTKPRKASKVPFRERNRRLREKRQRSAQKSLRATRGTNTDDT